MLCSCDKLIKKLSELLPLTPPDTRLSAPIEPSNKFEYPLAVYFIESVLLSFIGFSKALMLVVPKE